MDTVNGIARRKKLPTKLRMLRKACGYSPVSYTNLDVYKRQQLCLTGFDSLAAAQLLGGGSDDEIGYRKMCIRDRYNVGRLPYPVRDGILTVEIGPFCAMIFEEKVLDF